MGDTFIDSFSKGLNFAHTMENDRRLQAAQQQQAQMQQMQMMKLAAELSGIARQQQQQEVLSQSLQPVQEPSRFQQAPQQDNFGLSQNPPQELVSGGMRQSPFAKQLSAEFGNIAPRLVGMGYPIKDLPKMDTKSLENILADRVRSGEMTLQEAMSMKKSQEGKEPKGDFETFKAGVAQLPHETEQQWNARVSDLYDKRMTNRAIQGRSVFAAMPTGTPGVYFDRLKKDYMVNEDGVKRALTSDEAKQLKLQYQEETPTADLKTMQQAAPSVLELAKKSRASIDNAINGLGPLAGRWNELMSGKIGTANPDFRKVQVDIGLLKTRLMRMHVGARGGVDMLKHFTSLIDSSKDSPENLKAALEEIETYATHVMKPLKEQKEAGIATQTQDKTSSSPKTAQDFLRKKGLLQ
jgi:hypothetical protein